MRYALIVALLVCVSGCAATGQKFAEREYSAPDANGDQWIQTETIVSNRTIAPPFGAKANATHNFKAGVDADGNWDLVMGSAGALEGGEIANFVQALASMAAEITKLVAILEGAPAPLLEPLSPSP
jgi:outer membrane lipoprotein SlyB